MTEPFLRIPLSEAEAHRAELASTKAALAEALARVAALEARYEPPCGCGCQVDGKHWAVSAGVGDSRGGSHSGFSTVERALVWVVEESAGQWHTDGVNSYRKPWDPRTFSAQVGDTPLRLVDGFWFAAVGDLAPPAKKAKAKAKPVESAADDDDDDEDVWPARATTTPASTSACLCGRTFRTPQGLGLHMRRCKSTEATTSEAA